MYAYAWYIIATASDQHQSFCNKLVLRQNKLLSKEVLASQNKEIEHQKLIESKSAKIQAMQNEIQKFKWEMSDLSSTKNSRILELEAEVCLFFDFFRKTISYFVTSVFRKHVVL